MTESTTDDQETKFASDLREYFPDIWAFWGLFSTDHHYYRLIEAARNMSEECATGSIEVLYQKGKITYITQKKHLTAYRSNKLTTPKPSDSLIE